jgi:drug/metabolite transporter (DMT)-like permease
MNREKSSNAVLYFTPLIIWGSTWLVITFQLGKVEPLVSVVYRFFLASLILLIFLKIRKENLRYSITDHFFMALQGILLFGFNYWLVYIVEGVLSSGVTAVIFSVIVFFNSINAYIFLRAKIKGMVLLGGLVGMAGIALLFMDEIRSIRFTDKRFLLYLLAVAGAYIASLGNIVSLVNQRRKIPVLHSNGYGMLYGSIMMFLIVLFSGMRINIDLSARYMGSLLYLSVFGSIIAFYAYITVLGRIGADKAANVVLAAPVIAVILSSFFEKVMWTPVFISGILLVMFGNYIALRKK